VSANVPVCPHCAEPSEEPLVCGRCGWRWYRNPKPAAGTLVEANASVLLLRRAVEPGRGWWDLPAGYLEADESPEEGAVRETREEAGLEVELTRLAGVYTSRDGNALSVIFLARPVDPAAAVALDAESDDHAWVGRSQVAEWLPRMAFPSMAQALDDWANQRFGEPHW
jgi:ADP-ribose pyrophosphatase YjhB (NUDIX family)